MITGIDHIVIAATSLPGAIATYRELGFTVIEGGRHPYGSYNALIGFADGSYIEVLSFYEDSPDHPWWDLLHQRGGGLIDFCMATNDIRGDIRSFQAQGVDSGELTAGGRSRPDGFYVEWINNKVGAAWQGYLPFIIEDVTPRDERLPKERDHPNGVTGINCLTIATNAVPRYAAIMALVLGTEGQPVADEALSASGTRFEVGSHTLEYLAPDHDDSPLNTHLAANKPAPYRVSFKTTGGSAVYGPDQTEGVHLILASA